MLSPTDVNIAELPSLPLEQRLALPAIAAIYFVIDNQDMVLYVGRTSNLKKRWINHHHYKKLSLMKGVKVAYLLEEESLLNELEIAFINWFQPSLNKANPNPKAYKYQRPQDWIYGEKKKNKQFMLTETASTIIEAIAKELGISRSEVLERSIRSGGLQAAKKSLIKSDP